MSYGYCYERAVKIDVKKAQTVAIRAALSVSVSDMFKSSGSACTALSRTGECAEKARIRGKQRKRGVS